MMRKRTINNVASRSARTAALILWLGIGCCVSSAFAQEEREHDEPAPKQVLALQAFLPDEASEAIRAICMQAAEIAGGEVAFQWGAEPHVTLSACRVTADQKEAAVERFQDVALDELEPVTVRCRLTSREEGASTGWYLVPSEESRAAIDTFRQRAMTALDFEYEDFGGRSRTEWWPHLTLFSVPNAQASEAQSMVSELEAIAELQLSKLALVGFQSGIQTLSVRPLGR